MTQSMTGFASATLDKNGHQITIEVKSVNNRYLNVNFKSYQNIDRFEDVLRNEIQKLILRGSLTVSIKLKSQKLENTPEICLATAKKMVQNLSNIASELNISRQITWDTLSKIPGIIIESNNNNDADSEIQEALVECLNNALKKLVTMRHNEGERLKAKIIEGLDTIISLQKEIEIQHAGNKENHSKELLEKVKKTLEQIDEQQKLTINDIAREVAMIAERADITEEIQRISSHCKEIQSILKSNEHIGKKLDFMCQELNREFNTVCSKTKIIQISKAAVSGKLEVEQIREQVQNLE